MTYIERDNTIEEVELLDLVDEEDNCIWYATRDYIQEHNLLHRFIHVYVITEDTGKVLFQQRHHTKKSEPLQIDAAAGGHVLHGETYYQAAVRELQEELWIASNLQEIGRINCPGKIGKLFVCYIKDVSIPLSIQSSELARVDRLSIEEIKYL